MLIEEVICWVILPCVYGKIIMGNPIFDSPFFTTSLNLDKEEANKEVIIFGCNGGYRDDSNWYGRWHPAVEEFPNPVIG